MAHGIFNNLILRNNVYKEIIAQNVTLYDLDEYMVSEGYVTALDNDICDCLIYEQIDYTHKETGITLQISFYANDIDKDMIKHDEETDKLLESMLFITKVEII